MSRRLQWLVIAGLLVPVGFAEAQARPRMSIIRPRLERQFELRYRMPAFRRFEVQRNLFRRQVFQNWNMRLRAGSMFRGRAFNLMPRGPALMRFRMGRRRLMRI